MPRLPFRSARSLRWRLTRTISLAVLLVWGVAGLLSYSQAQHEAEELMDGNLAQNARLLLALALHNEPNLADLAQRLASTRNDNESLYEPPLEFQLARPDGRLLIRSVNAPDSVLTEQPGYTDILRDGEAWRVFQQEDGANGHRALVFRSLRIRDATALEIALRTALPIALILPLSLLLIYYAIRRSLQPVDALSRQVAARSPENLAELESRNAPLEIQGLAQALNALLQRLQRALDNERRFTADAAHELRTPLASIKIHAQVAALSKEPAQQQAALGKTLQGVDRATRVVEQLLRLARLDPLARPADSRRVNLSDLAQDLAGETEATAAPLRLDLPDGNIAVDGDRDLLLLAWRNLLENARRYTPPGGGIGIYARQRDGQILLGVSDDGPGCADAELPHLSERFYRGRSAGGEGSGLGLTIVHRIAEIHGARLALANRPGGGFDASLCWAVAPDGPIATTAPEKISG